MRVMIAKNGNLTLLERIKFPKLAIMKSAGRSRPRPHTTTHPDEHASRAKPTPTRPTIWFVTDQVGKDMDGPANRSRAG
jgi:hypothetical protein